MTSVLKCAVAITVVASASLSYGTGALPGLTGSAGTVNPLVTRDLSGSNGSCGECHNAFPGGGPTPLRVWVDVGRRALQPNEATAMTVRATGGQVTLPPLVDVGGFCMDCTAGFFVPGANSQIDPTGMAVTHRLASQSNGRTWGFGFTAPPSPGRVQAFCVVNTGDGDGQPTADVWGFHGFDATSPRSTPIELFVLAPGVAYLGDGCADGYGNRAVLGAAQTPAVGNGAFGLELHGATPGSLAFFLVAINPPGFQPQDLSPLGIQGCSAFVANPITNVVATGPGQASISEGSATLAWPIPAVATLRGVTVQTQACYLDQAAAAIAGRSLPLTFSNALSLTVQ
ncbi:MAG: hypothetical protein IPK26_02335 [Planctomycetes bacterium]|nr:hypothetical protein [Planctomycetota bacterium]